jgi:hypothetical protein
MTMYFMGNTTRSTCEGQGSFPEQGFQGFQGSFDVFEATNQGKSGLP